MIEECNFKSRIRHRAKSGCNLTPTEDVCPGEENCILFQTYYKLGILQKKEKEQNNKTDITDKK